MVQQSQRGVALAGLIIWIAILGFVFLTGLKILPAWNEYFSILQSINKIETSGETSVLSAKKAFDRFAEVNSISSIRGSDVDFEMEAGRLKGRFDYDTRVQLFANVSLVFNFTDR